MIKAVAKYLFLGLMPMAFGEAIILAPSAQAGETCNYINRNLWMAQAYQNANQVWVSEGWWVIEPGECVSYADNVSTFFKIAEDSIPSRPKIENSKTKALCVINDRFTVFQADNPTACDGSLETFVGFDSTKELLKD